MHPAPARRRVIRIAAAATLAQLIAPAPCSRADEDRVSAWRGLTMGSLTRVDIRHPDTARAAQVLDLAQREIARLDAMFTLYRPDSALARLNRDGRLKDPPFDLVRLLAEARTHADLTGGAFDVSVQPIWQSYAAHFTVAGADPAGPSRDTLRRAADLVDYRAIAIEADAVRLIRPGMALTLNGIAPGYIADRIVELLKNEGLAHALVDLGEVRAMGSRTAREPWRAAVRDPRDGGRMIMELPLDDQAISTSGAYGFRFDPAGRFHHLFDPRSGACPQVYDSVSVLAPSATTADALSTAFQTMGPIAMSASLRAAGATRAICALPMGTVRVIES